MLVTTGLLLAACAAGGERARGGLAAPGGHAYVDAAIIEALDDAPGCCPTLDRLPYQPLAAHGQFAVALTIDSPAFDFASGKSFFAAYSLAGLARPFTLEIASRLPDASAPNGPRPLIAPSALILDADHRVVRQIDSEPSPAICRPGDRSVAYSLRWRSDTVPSDAAYLIVLTTEQTRSVKQKLLCGVVHHGLSPVGEIAVGTYDDRYGMGDAAAIGVRAHRHDGSGRRPQTAGGSPAAEPGVLLVGDAAIRYLERTLVGFRPTLEIPFDRIDFARASAGAAWQRAGRRLSIGYRPAASAELATIEFEPDCSGPEPVLFADQLAEEIESRFPAAGAARR